MNDWILVADTLPPFDKLVALINIDRVMNDPAGWYPIAHIGHLSEFGGKYWSIMGERGTVLDYFTHWAELPKFPEEFLEKFDNE